MHNVVVHYYEEEGKEGTLGELFCKLPVHYSLARYTQVHYASHGFRGAGVTMES